MNCQQNSEIITLSKTVQLQCHSSISSWASNNQFYIFGTLSGSLILYHKSKISKNYILAFSELTEPIMVIKLLSDRINDVIIGTKKGSIAVVSFEYTNGGISEHLYNLLKFDEEIIDMILHINESLLVCTKRRVILLRYEMAQNTVIKIVENRVLFETESEIIQVNASETRVLVSTWKSYFIVNIFNQECVQVGTKEKQGLHGSTFFQDDTGI